MILHFTTHLLQGCQNQAPCFPHLILQDSLQGDSRDDPYSLPDLHIAYMILYGTFSSVIVLKKMTLHMQSSQLSFLKNMLEGNIIGRGAIGSKITKQKPSNRGDPITPYPVHEKRGRMGDPHYSIIIPPRGHKKRKGNPIPHYLIITGKEANPICFAISF